MSMTAKVPAVKLKHILVATDLSPSSLCSLPYVTELARHYGSTIYMGHVIPFGTFAAARPQSFDAIERECREHAQDRLNMLSAEIKAEGIQVETVLTEGDVGIEIAEWIGKLDIDLIAVGTIGRSGVRKFVLGSVAEEIVRESRCPVLTVGPAVCTEMPVALRSILYATDFSNDSMQAARYALSIASQHNARLIVLHVTDQESEESKLAASKKMNELWPQNTKVANRTEVLVAEGKPSKKILETAGEHSIDLIVIGVRGAGGFSRAASHFGSTAHDIIVSAACPVLSVGAPRQ